MEINHGMVADVQIPNLVEMKGDESNMENFKFQLDEMFVKVDQLEQRLNEVEQFYLTANKKKQTIPKGNLAQKDKEKEKQISGFRRRQQDAARREAAAAKRMQELVRQFDTKIISQLIQHRWAGPFMEPVDVVGLELHDYYEVIEKPMDFTTIRAKIEAKDGTGYKHVRELYADVKLIFKNAIKYNDERDNVHVMAKTLLEKLNEKWIQLLPKVDEENRALAQDKRRKEEEAEAQLDIKLAQEALHAKMARELCIELDEVDMHLEELRETVLQSCRKMSTEEKRRLGTALTQLSPEDLNKALLIVAQNNPSFQATAEEVDLDMDAQSESTLWKLKLFVKDTLQVSKSPGSVAVNNTASNNQNNAAIAANNKRKREICVALAKSSQKKAKKPSGI
ncbi:hypothetical protein M9H77_35623 [Catharanthus roseus]|uniref:Uncharacterized protein n=1 Tax=Catharanthus roseus TaxID=4058 RepID=A0ACB9ZQA1_CATRO|nr:hypothetical protein M9H77_35623 [Catharanthus roseus]